MRQGRATHWVVLYNLRKKPVYFDSFGVWPPQELAKIKNLVSNEYRTQSHDSSNCGLCCIHIMNELLARRKFFNILLDFSPTNYEKIDMNIFNTLKSDFPFL